MADETTRLRKPLADYTMAEYESELLPLMYTPEERAEMLAASERRLAIAAALLEPRRRVRRRMLRKLRKGQEAISGTS